MRGGAVGVSLAIVAGGGSLPRLLAERCRRQGDPYRLYAIRGAAGAWAREHSARWFSLPEIQPVLGELAQSGCSELCLAGSVSRPSDDEALPGLAGNDPMAGVAEAMRRGDDALLRAVAGRVESVGLRVIGVEERMPDLLAPAGSVAGPPPDAADIEDIERGAVIAAALGAVDVGQAVAVAEGRCLAVETVEGTAAMLRRISRMSVAERGGARQGRGVLVKAVKPGQDCRFDRPAAGPDTLAAVRAAGLRGLAVEAGGVLLLDRERMAAAGRQGGDVFLYGFARSGR